MKKISIITSVLYLAAAVSFAQNSPTAAPKQEGISTNKPQQMEAKEVKKVAKKPEIQNIMGEVMKINTEKNEKGDIIKAEVVLKTNKGENKIQIEPKDLPLLKEGMKVKIKIVDGKVENIKEIKKHQAREGMKKEKAQNKPVDSNPTQAASNTK